MKRFNWFWTLCSQVLGLFLFTIPALSQGTFTLVDSEFVPGPGDNLVVVEKGKKDENAIVITTGHDTNEVRSFVLRKNSQLTSADALPSGAGPRAIAMARDGSYAVVVNSNDDSASVYAVGANGSMKQVGTFPSGGDNPFDVAVAFDDLVVIANRDADQIALFKIDRRGNMRPLGSVAAGIDPHVIAIGPNGTVAVANSTSEDVATYQMNKGGNVNLLARDSRANLTTPIGASPQDVEFDPKGEYLFVATRSKQFGIVDDQIQAYQVLEDSEGIVNLIPSGNIPAGLFLTDIEVTKDRLFAVTVNASGKDEIRSYLRTGSELVLEDSLEFPDSSPSFKQLTVLKGRRSVKYRLLVTGYQGGWLRSLELRKD